MQNDKIKEYWEGEAGIYSEGIKAELQSETAENWKNLILEYAPENKACKAYRNLAEEVAGVWSCAEKRRQDKGISTYCSCGGTGCADSGTGSGEGTEVMAGGESI